MINVLDKLKTIFKGKVGNIFSDNKNNKFVLFDFSRNTTNVLEVKLIEGVKQKLAIDLSKANDEEKKEVKKLLDEEKDDNKAILTNNSVSKTKEIKRGLSEIDNTLLDYYKNKISSDMYEALEMSLIVRSAFRRGEDIMELKRDIGYKFPDFGYNICNLASGGYFDTYFKELYNIMSSESDFNIEQYKEELKWIVKELPYMVFISRFKSYNEYSGEVFFKLGKLKLYGTNKLKLHAIGTDNVERALHIAKEYESKPHLVKKINSDINSARTKAVITFNLK